MPHSEGDCYDDPCCKLCLQLDTFKNCLYDLPNGSVGRDFVTWLPSQIDLLSQVSVHSERVLVFYFYHVAVRPNGLEGHRHPLLA